MYELKNNFSVKKILSLFLVVVVLGALSIISRSISKLVNHSGSNISVSELLANEAQADIVGSGGGTGSFDACTESGGSDGG